MGERRDGERGERGERVGDRVRENGRERVKEGDMGRERVNLEGERGREMDIDGWREGERGVPTV